MSTQSRSTDHPFSEIAEDMEAARTACAVEPLPQPIPAAPFNDETEARDEHPFVAIEEEMSRERATVVQFPVPAAPSPRIDVLPAGSKGQFEMVVKGLHVVPEPHSQANIRVALNRMGVTARYEEFAARVYLTYKGRTEALDDANERRLWLLLEELFRLKPTQGYFREVLLNEAHLHAYHAVREYLSSLLWDNVPRVDTWLIKYAGAADSEFVRKASELWLVAAVRRVRQPGCKFDEILVEEGPQGIGKSSLLRELLPDPNWFTDNVKLTMSTKEVIEQTLGKWIIEIPELSGMSGAEIEHVKTVLSRVEDGARQAYGRYRTDRPRQFVLAATTNDDIYLRDTTGNRRFWPVVTTRIDLDGIKAVRDQLWAEAAVLEASGASIRLPEHLWPAAAADQEQRLVTDPWEDSIPRLIAAHPVWKDRIPREEVWTLLGIPPDRRDKKLMMRLTQVMKRLGWKVQTVFDPLSKQRANGFARVSP